jgi:hypothetical protein
MGECAVTRSAGQSYRSATNPTEDTVEGGIVDPFLTLVYLKHARFAALGRTDALRPLFVVFTIRGRRIRVISVRPMSPGERRIYVQAQAQSEAGS